MSQENVEIVKRLYADPRGSTAATNEMVPACSTPRSRTTMDGTALASGVFIAWSRVEGDWPTHWHSALASRPETA